MPHAAGLMSVSQAYIDNLLTRYQRLQNKPSLLLPFGVSANDTGEGVRTGHPNRNEDKGDATNIGGYPS